MRILAKSDIGKIDFSLINIEDDVENGDQFTTAKVLAEYLKDKEYTNLSGGEMQLVFLV